VRLRPPQLESRFGVPLGSFPVFQQLILLLQGLPPEVDLGLHVHLDSSMIGVKRWWSVLEAVLLWADAIGSESGRPVHTLDLGGGWFPDDWYEGLHPNLGEVVSRSRRALPELGRILLEPGKALVQPSTVLLTRVLEARQIDGVREVVVDASIADLSQAGAFPHRIYWRESSGQWRPLPYGAGRVLGRICMENDILGSNVEIPPELDRGDLLVVGDCGAYDRSMSYAFGTG
jgi:diaminopimelate decarboxylase